MKYEGLKKYAWSLTVAVMLVLSSGLTGSTVVQAQSRDRGEDRGRYNRDEEKGYHDGLDRGQEDARDRRIPTPNNSSHYRKGSEAYRRGFRRGYAQGYRGHYWWW
jgi:Ni/Co efflux regulator RcnB